MRLRGITRAQKARMRGRPLEINDTLILRQCLFRVHKVYDSVRICKTRLKRETFDQPFEIPVQLEISIESSSDSDILPVHARNHFSMKRFAREE